MSLQPLSLRFILEIFASSHLRNRAFHCVVKSDGLVQQM
jgi:hypothetical protein